MVSHSQSTANEPGGCLPCDPVDRQRRPGPVVLIERAMTRRRIDNWNNVVFWKDGEITAAPWVANPAKWQPYAQELERRQRVNVNT
jgi:hypothetical protein